MSRTIKVANADNEPSYVIAEPEQRIDGPYTFFLTNNDAVQHVAAGHFEGPDGESYYVQDQDDIEWLTRLQ
jgi:hypothetical protein